jgi:hypothetical protein
MDLNTLLAIILSIFVVTSYTSEEKKGPLYKLCGDDFSAAHADCCHNGCANVPYFAPSVVEALEKRGGYEEFSLILSL